MLLGQGIGRVGGLLGQGGINGLKLTQVMDSAASIYLNFFSELKMVVFSPTFMHRLVDIHCCSSMHTLSWPYGAYAYHSDLILLLTHILGCPFGRHAAT